MTAPDENNETFVVTSSREEVILRLSNDGESGENRRKSCGFHLTRSKWDPYPWVGSVEKGSVADRAGLRAGDSLLEISGRDIVGLRVKEIASLIYENNEACVRLQVWRRPDESSEVTERSEGYGGAALEGPLPEVARKLASAVSGAIRAMECPVCLESAAPPVSQCVHGHILCAGCRLKTDRCPVCRVRLGQGRCLLADKFHRTLQEAFNIAESEEKLRERLFGRRRKSNDLSRGASGTGRVPVGPRQLLARLFLGGVDRAASAENLSAETQRDDRSRLQAFPRRLGELGSCDRAKSASTGELSTEPRSHPDPIRNLIINGSNPDISSMGLQCTLSVPQTPAWGGSTESVSSTLVRCPLSSSNGCKEMVTPGIVLEHLGRAHEGPQVHFFQGTATIPIPAPLGPSAIYILHHGGEIFFFKHDNEAVCMTTLDGGSDWSWVLKGWGADGTEVKLRRSVATLEDPASPHPHQIAPLPKALAIHTVEIQLVESPSTEAVEM